MGWHIVDTWIVIDALIIAVSASLVGTHMVLKRESLMSDAISHAVLPGIALGYLISSSRDSIFIFLGAILFGIVTAMLTRYIRTEGKIESNASLGVVFSGFFAIGLIIISKVASRVDLDPTCVLFGSIELTPLERVTLEWLGGISIPRAVISNAVVLLVNAIVLLFIGRHLNASVFDEDFSRSIGLRTKTLWYVHILLVAITSVAAFESVGSLLIIALLVVPPAAAWLLCTSLRTMMVTAVGIGMLGVVVGHGTAVFAPTMWGIENINTGGSIATALGIIFGLTVICSPQYGLLHRAYYILGNRLHIAKEDVLKTALASPRDVQFSQDSGADLGFFKKYFVKRILLKERSITYERRESRYVFTSEGRKRAEKLREKHRLWEHYFYQSAHVRAPDVHEKAETIEHVKGKEIEEQLKKSTVRREKIPGHSH